MPLKTELYTEQCKIWPASGQHILAHYDEETIIVYQAYRPAIAEYAIKHQKFGGEFKYSRMSWIKPNFLWMMYRSGWGCKEGQEAVLGIRLSRRFFDSLLAQAVVSSFAASDFASEEDWRKAVEASEVRLQWDPDHDPLGQKLTRRAVQLGLRGPSLADYGQREVLEIIDLREFVATQRAFAKPPFAGLLVPRERTYRPLGWKTSL